MSKITGKDFSKFFDDYVSNQKWLNDVELEIIGGENVVDPLILLRIYEDKVTVQNNLELAQAFCMNKTVRFTKNGETILDVTYDGTKSLSEHFKDTPYLMDILLKTCYGLMLKKLTPPSSDSAIGEEK